MNVKLASYCASVLMAASLCAYADEPGPKKGSAEFERMKSLVGTWKGKTDMTGAGGNHGALPHAGGRERFGGARF